MFHFLDSLTTTDLLTLLADLFNFFLLLATITAVILAYRQIKESYKTQKATFFKELYLTIFSDSDIRTAYHLINYERFVYDNDHFQDSEARQNAIEHLLSIFNIICDLYEQNILTEYEMRTFKYKILRVYQSADVQRYIAFLDVFYLTIGVQTQQFQSFRSFCEKEQQKAQHVQSLSIDQAYWFYKEQKSKLDKLFVFAEQALPPNKDDEPHFEHQIRILAELKARFQYPDKFNQGDIICEAIKESGVYDPARVIIGLDALRARLLIDENKRMQKEVYIVPNTISIEHLFKNPS